MTGKTSVCKCKTGRCECWHATHDPKYKHLCRSEKARMAADLILQALRGAGREGMSRRELQAATGLNDKWFVQGKMYWRTHPEVLGTAEPYAHDNRKDSGAGRYYINASDEVVVEHLIARWRTIGEQLSREVNLSLSRLQNRYAGSEEGQEILEEVRDDVTHMMNRLRHNVRRLKRVESTVVVQETAEELVSTP